MLEDVVAEVMKTVNLQPLQFLGAVRVALSVCESEDFPGMIKRFRKTLSHDGAVGFSDTDWNRLCFKATENLAKVGVPDLIINIIWKSLRQISFEIFKWNLYHVEAMGIDCPSDFCWTQHVNIDYIKTAEILIKNEALDIKNRFKLACFYCLDSEVRSLWKQMNMSKKTSFYVQKNFEKSDENPIVLYWICCMQGKKMNYRGRGTQAAELFKYAVKNGYLSAIKYFFGKLKLQIRIRMILNSLNIHLPSSNIFLPLFIVRDHLAIACFLISKIPPNYHVRDADLGLVFCHFLEWPWQSHFIVIVNRLRCHIREATFSCLLGRIVEKDLKGFEDYAYKELFMKLWLQGPEQYKTFVNTRTIMGFKICMNFAKKHFEFIFEENSFALKAKLRNIIFKREISESGIRKENVEFFKFLVRERVITKTIIDIFSRHHFMGDDKNRPLIFAPDHFILHEFSKVPLGELIYLMDGILEMVPFYPEYCRCLR